MAGIIMKSELNSFNFKKCGEISALLLQDKQEFHLSCLFCEFTYIQLKDFIQHIYDDHFLELPRSIKQETAPLYSQESLGNYGVENCVELSLENDLKGMSTSEKSLDTELLSNDETDRLDTNNTVSGEDILQDGKENLLIEIMDIQNDVDDSNDFDEKGSVSEAYQNETNPKTRRKKKQNQSKPVTKEIKITDTILNIAQCIILAQTYKNYTCLWDEKDIAYRFKNRRDKAVKSVHEEFNKKTGLKLTEYEFEREVLRLRKICTYEKKQKIMSAKSKMEHKASCIYYNHIEYLEIDVAPFVCPICEEQYPALGKLKVHVASHDGSLPFKCYICERSFQLGGNLTTHLRRHAQDYTYYCDICNKGWATSSDKKMHMRIHTGEKPYVCYICGSTFVTASRLAEHTRTSHKKLRCYECEICSKAFYSSKVLNEHKKTHSNVRDHICEICEKGFKSNKYLEQHKRIHDSVKRYVCKICGKRFAQSAGIGRHMMSHGTSLCK